MNVRGRQKILIVALRGPTNAQRRGGAQDYILNIAAPWVHQGHQVDVLCGQELVASSLLPATETLHGITVQRVGTPGNRALPIIRHAVRLAATCDVVIENITGFPLMLPLWLQRKKRLVAIKHHFEGPTFFSTQGYVKGAYGIVLEEVVQPLVYRDTPFVTVSTKTARELRGKWIRPRAPLAVVPPGISQALHGAHTDVARNAAPTVVYLGALNLGRKRVDHLIQAFREVLQHVFDAQLIIGGQGPDEARLRRQAAGLPVRFAGFVSEEEKRSMLTGAWVFASPSQSEGFGITWVEANAYGLPVIGYELGLDTVNESCARMVPTGNVSALSRALIEVLSDESLRQRMQAAAFENARRFDWNVSSRQFMDFLQQHA